MPYFGWLENERMFILDQGGFGQKEQFSIGFSIEIEPQTGATDEMEKILTGLFESCMCGTGLQISLYASPDISPMLERQANMVQVGELAGIAERRNKFYMGGTGQVALQQQNLLVAQFPLRGVNFNAIIAIRAKRCRERDQSEGEYPRYTSFSLSGRVRLDARPSA